MLLGGRFQTALLYISVRQVKPTIICWVPFLTIFLSPPLSIPLSVYPWWSRMKRWIRWTCSPSRSTRSRWREASCPTSWLTWRSPSPMKSAWPPSPPTALETMSVAPSSTQSVSSNLLAPGAKVATPMILILIIIINNWPSRPFLCSFWHLFKYCFLNEYYYSYVKGYSDNLCVFPFSQPTFTQDLQVRISLFLSSPPFSFTLPFFPHSALSLFLSSRQAIWFNYAAQAGEVESDAKWAQLKSHFLQPRRLENNRKQIEEVHVRRWVGHES